MPMILNEEQNMLKDTAKEFCTEKAPISQLRKLRDDADANGFDRDVWTSMAELGWAGIPFPEQFGGLDFGYKGLGVVTEETGRTLAASPLFASVWVCGTALNIGGSDAQKAALLPQVGSGDLLLALALGRVASPRSVRRRDGGRAIRKRVRANRIENVCPRRPRCRQARGRGAYFGRGRRAGRHYAFPGRRRRPQAWKSLARQW